MLTTINGAQLNFEIRGEGYPLVILHGFRLDLDVMMGAYEPIFAERDGFKRIYVDMPGMGLTPGTNDLCSSDAIVELLCGMIDQFIPDQHFLLVGFSFGGYIARGILKRKQALVDGMMLIAPVADPAHRDLPDFQVIFHDPEVVSMLPESLAPMVLGTLTVQTKPIIQRIIDEYSAAFTRLDQDFVARLAERDNYLFTDDVDALETPFDKPALIFTGKQDANVGYSDAFILSRKYPRATYIVMDRAAHGVYLEQDAVFKMMVNEWLDRVLEAREHAILVH